MIRVEVIKEAIKKLQLAIIEKIRTRGGWRRKKLEIRAIIECNCSDKSVSSYVEERNDGLSQRHLQLKGVSKVGGSQDPILGYLSFEYGSFANRWVDTLPVKAQRVDKSSPGNKIRETRQQTNDGNGSGYCGQFEMCFWVRGVSGRRHSCFASAIFLLFSLLQPQARYCIKRSPRRTES